MNSKYRPHRTRARIFEQMGRHKGLHRDNYENFITLEKNRLGYRKRVKRNHEKNDSKRNKQPNRDRQNR